MSGDRYTKHASGTALCVTLALDAVEADLLRELDTASQHTAAALNRVLARIKVRREAITDLLDQQPDASSGSRLTQ